MKQGKHNATKSRSLAFVDMMGILLSTIIEKRGDIFDCILFDTETILEQNCDGK